MKKFKILFERSNGEKKLLGYTGDLTEQPVQLNEYNPNLRNASKMIRRFLSNYPNFKHYYTRITGPVINAEHGTGEERVWCYDVGSWSEFFYVIETSEEWIPKGEENTYENYSTEFFTVLNPEKSEKEEEEDED